MATLAMDGFGAFLCCGASPLGGQIVAYSWVKSIRRSSGSGNLFKRPIEHLHGGRTCGQKIPRLRAEGFRGAHSDLLQA